MNNNKEYQKIIRTKKLMDIGFRLKKCQDQMENLKRVIKNNEFINQKDVNDFRNLGLEILAITREVNKCTAEAEEKRRLKKAKAAWKKDAKKAHKACDYKWLETYSTKAAHYGSAFNAYTKYSVKYLTDYFLKGKRY